MSKSRINPRLWPPSSDLRRDGIHGFTLVELLVVIGIISVLIAILMPALNAARMAAINVQCQSNLRQCGQAMALYEDDNHGILPHGDNQNSCTSWSRQIAKYLNIKETSTGTYGYYLHLIRQVPNVLECPIEDYRPPESLYKTYAYNYLLSDRNEGRPGQKYPLFKFWRHTQIITASHKIILQDTSYGGGWMGYLPATSSASGTPVNEHSLSLYPKHGKRQSQFLGTPSNYRGIGTTLNCLFCDGHVEAMYPKELGTSNPTSSEQKSLMRSYYDLFGQFK